MGVYGNYPGQAQPGAYPYQVPYYQQLQQIQQMQQQAQQMMQQPQPQQGMTRPTVHADIIQVYSIQEAETFNLQPGQRQMFMNADETEIYIKEAYQNGPPSMEIFVKRPPEPPKPELDPAQFVTKEELEKRLEALQTRRKGTKAEEAEE